MGLDDGDNPAGAPVSGERIDERDPAAVVAGVEGDPGDKGGDEGREVAPDLFSIGVQGKKT